MSLSHGTRQAGDPLERNAQNQKILKGAASMVASGSLTPDGFRLILDQDQLIDSFTKLDIVNGIGGTSDDKNLGWVNAIQEKIVSEMIFADAENAIAVLIEDPSPRNLFLIDSAIQQWLEIDNNKATDWQSTNMANLSSTQQDHVIAGFIKHALRFGEVEGAKLWLARIQDENLRKSFAAAMKDSSNSQ